MKEIRVTFRGEDFAAVSRSMIDSGVRFQVEPSSADMTWPFPPVAP